MFLSASLLFVLGGVAQLVATIDPLIHFMASGWEWATTFTTTSTTITLAIAALLVCIKLRPAKVTDHDDEPQVPTPLLVTQLP